MAIGRPAAQVGLYHPANSMWMGDEEADRSTTKLGWQLVENQVDWDYFDEESLESVATIATAASRTSAARSTGPSWFLLDGDHEAGLERFQAFFKAGGKLIFVGKTPTMSTSQPRSRFSAFAAPAKPPPLAPPTYYLPSFRLIRCELIGGPETGSIETPLIGVVLDNQYNIDADGVTRLVVPAGVEVHGTGKSSPSRDRIDGNGKWTLVWRTNDGNNAMELSVSGIALNRDYDDAKHAYGDAEKSPGIAGRHFGSLGDQAIQEALLASVAAVTRSVKSYTSVLNPLTSQVVNEPKATIGNALLEGGAAGTDRIADMIDAIRKQIDEKGYYVAVLPGKEFYLYTKEPIDLRKARRPAESDSGAKAVSGGKDRS